MIKGVHVKNILYKIMATSALLVPLAGQALDGEFYLKPYLGLSELSDKDGNTSGIGSINGNGGIELDS